MATTDESHERYDFLDWLRVIAIFVLFFFHTGMIFVGSGWHIVNKETIPSLQWPIEIAHRLRMPLLFVIAGAGMWFALGRRTTGQFLRERTGKLLLPLVTGMLLVVPPQIYYEWRLQGQWNVSWHHLWFILYLYVYILLLLPVMLWWRGVARHIAPGTWLLCLGIPLGINEHFLKPLFSETHNLVDDWYIFIHYLLLTSYGYFMASTPGMWKWLCQFRRRSLVLGVMAFVLLVWGFDTGLIQHDSIADQVGANVFTWFWVMVFLGYGYRYLSFANPLLAWAREASYPFYILHQTVIVVIGYYVVQYAWAPWVKYVTILALSMVACLVLYQLCVRRFAVLRLAFAMKTPAGSPRRDSTSSRRPSRHNVE
ncbi:MAG: acyltransferase family protein [Luteibacter sp.]